MAQAVGQLYGMTVAESNIFKYDPITQTGTNVWYFTGSGGGNPYGDLIQASNGLLYGMTQLGGANNEGVIFSLDPISGSFVPLFNFKDTMGIQPTGSLVQASNGLLYGGTYQGGIYNQGVLFSYDPVNAKYDTLLSFNGTNGAYCRQSSLMLAANGSLYGVTNGGGSNGEGALFSYDPTTAIYTVLQSFKANGNLPSGGVTQVNDSLLYGLTSSGGTTGGVIYSYNLNSNALNVVYELDDSSGYSPYGKLLLASNGLLYGMAISGGRYNNGTFFCFSPSNNSLTTIFNFNGTNGSAIFGSLIQGADSVLYGMTERGGADNAGAIFSYNISKDSVAFPFFFDFFDGEYPIGDLLEVMSANLTQTNNQCFGDSVGTAALHVRGGKYPLKYIWSNGDSTDSVSKLPAGNYSVKIIDMVGKGVSLSFTITQPSKLKDSIAGVTNVSCNAGNNGAITVTVKGGVKPYIYSWSPGSQIDTTINGLVAGSYVFTATDYNHCAAPDTIKITQPAALKDSIDSVADVLCYGGNNGSIRVTVKGGIKPYLYSWSGKSGNIGSDSLVNNLITGSYTCQVTDGHSCITPISVTITSPAAINDSTSYTSTPCTKSTGSAGVFDVTGGVYPYSYLWSPGADTNAADTGLTSGSYTCTITDSNKCIQKAFVVVPNTGGPRDSIIASTNETCFGQNIGSATAGVKGGYPPYTFKWSPGGGSATTANNLPATKYTFSVTDSVGCVSTATVAITEPTQLRDSITAATNVSCFGFSNGRVVISTKGGVPPYNYLWSGGAGTADSATNLIAGTYSCTISDFSNCIAPPQTITITSPSILNTDTAATATKCGTSNGSATAITTGGIRPYSYLWSNSGIDSSITNVSGGINYLCTITDAQGCMNKINVIVPDTGGPRDTILLNQSIQCYGSNSGTAIANVLSGTPPYTYLWSSSAGTNGFAINLAAGTYSCTVTDATGCQGIAQITLNQPPQLIYSFNNIGVCYGANSGGTAIINVNGGTGPYQYSWSPDSSLTDSLINIEPGAYLCTVTDANNCKTFATTTIAEATKLSIDSIVSYPTSCPTCNNGWVQVYASGGIPAGDSIYYLYVWDTIVNASSIHSLDTGMFHVCVTTNYCPNESVCDSAEVITNVSTINNLNDVVKIFPVPSSGLVYMQLPEMGMSTVNVFDEMGRDVYLNILDASQQRNIINLNLEELPNGIYTVQIKNARAVINKKLVIQK